MKPNCKLTKLRCMCIIILFVLFIITLNSTYDVEIYELIKGENKHMNDMINYDISEELFNTLLTFYIPHYIFIDMNTIGSNNYSCSLTFCCTVGGLGIGNVLSQYWFARSLSYFMQCDFKMYSGLNKTDPCSSLKFGSSGRHRYGLQKKMFNIHYFANYLPKYWKANTDYYHLYHKYFDINANLEFILYLLHSCNQLRIGQHDYFPYAHNMRLLYYNTEFIENIAMNDTQNAFKLYHHSLKHNTSSIDSADIVIHYRCGDLLSRRNTNLYGLLSMSYYVKALQIISKYHQQKTIKNIWILTQFGTNTLLTESIWGRNIYAVNKAQTLSQILVENYIVPALFKLFSSVYNDINITVFGNNNVDDDFYSFVKAPILICSLSSFCSVAALGNNNLVIMPQGALFNQTEILLMQIPSNHKQIMIDIQNGMLLTTMQIVDNHMNISSIGMYLLNH